MKLWRRIAAGVAGLVILAGCSTPGATESTRAGMKSHEIRNLEEKGRKPLIDMGFTDAHFINVYGNDDIMFSAAVGPCSLSVVMTREGKFFYVTNRPVKNDKGEVQYTEDGAIRYERVPIVTAADLKTQDNLQNCFPVATTPATPSTTS